MADFSVNSPRHHRGARSEGLEYRLYFALIFLFALPFAVAGCIWSLLRHGRLTAGGPLARARAEAHQIAPMIFRG
jgi:hypothetical protein